MNHRKHLLAALALAVLTLLPAAAFAGLFVSVNIAPPALPVYVQPVCPGPDFIWTPGYWAYGDEGYYWVPGTWVLAPRPGFLWTPGYWGWDGGIYRWNAGYWGPHVGFYGGVNYGFGYLGVGFVGGRWGGDGHFQYNSAVSNVNVTSIHNVYRDTTVINNVTVNRVSFNGGHGGIQARATSEQMAAAHENHIAATAAQMHHVQAAATNRALLASVNHGRPAIAATARPGAFHGAGVVHATGATHAAGMAHGPSSGFAPHTAPGAGARAASAHHPIATAPANRPQFQHAPGAGPSHSQGPHPAQPKHFGAQPAPQHFGTRPAPQHFGPPPAQHVGGPPPGQHPARPQEQHSGPSPGEHRKGP
jgi:hypothetical protein